jgi:hypothetical protein
MLLDIYKNHGNRETPHTAFRILLILVFIAGFATLAILFGTHVNTG